MSRYLIRTVETWRADTESEAKKMIEEAQKDDNFNLGKYSSEYKERKVKGEVEDAWYRVTLTKEFTNEKEPDLTTTIEYSTSYGTFPSPISHEEDEEDSAW